MITFKFFIPNHAHLVRKIGLEFGDALQPISAALLRNEFDVQEGALAGPVQVPGCCSAYNARGDVSDQILKRGGGDP